MKTTNWQKLRLGIFVLTGTLLFVAAVYFIGQRESMFRKTFTVSTYFQNVNGLQKGNNVRYSGIVVGAVKDIIMINDSTIQVKLSIEEAIIPHVKKNAIATIGSDGLVGNMIVNIVPGKTISSVIEDNDTIASYSRIRTDNILKTLNTSSENAAILTSDLLKITNSITTGSGTIGVLLNDTLMARDLKQSIANVKQASSSANRAIQELTKTVSVLKIDERSVLGVLLNDSISGNKLKDMFSHLESSSLKIDGVLDSVNLILEDFRSGKGTYQYLLNDTTAVHNLKSTLKNINEGTDKFNQNMEALKHNFLTRGYFRKLGREAKKETNKTN